MAKRLNPRHTELVREKIRTSYLINRLTAHVEGKVELSSAQVQSARILLDKSIGNAPQVTELTGADGAPLLPVHINIGFGNGGPGSGTPSSGSKGS
jgi:hypothetical protein